MIGYLKCDAPGCDYEEDNEGLEESMIGKPCPKCGASLLTQEDYEAWLRMSKLLDAFAQLGLVQVVKRDHQPSEGEISLSINPHAGAVNVKIKGGA